MIPYIILFVILLCCSFFEVYNSSISDEFGIAHKTSSKATYAILPAVIILILGIFRETTVGHDSEAYYIYYWSQLDTHSWVELLTDFSTDNGFYIILKVIALFTEDWWCVRAILFAMTFGLYYSALRRESPYPTMSLLIFLGLANLGLMFGILRQALAGAVSLYAYRQIQKGYWIKCLLLILVAATIHKTALLCVFMLLIYFMRLRKFSRIELVLLSVFSYTVFFAAIPLITLIYEGSRYVDIAASDGGYGMLLFILVVIILSGHLMCMIGGNKNRKLSYLFNLSCGALLIQIGALQWSLLNRTTVLFSIYWCILLPQLIGRLPKRKRLQYYLIVAILFGVMFFYQLADVEMFVLHQF